MSGPLGLDWVDNSEGWDPSNPAVLATVYKHGSDTFADRIHPLGDGYLRQQVLADDNPFASTYFDIDSLLASMSKSDNGETPAGGESSPGGLSNLSAGTDDSTENTPGVRWLLGGGGSRRDFVVLGVAVVVVIDTVAFGDG